MLNMVSTWIDFGYAYLKRDTVGGLGKGYIPPTPTSEECFVIYIYLTTSAQPIYVTFNSEEERDEKYEEFKSLI